LASKISAQHPEASVELIDGGRGDFVVMRDGTKLWDKRNDQGRFPDDAEILTALAV